MAAKRDSLLVATETFSVDLDGREVVVWKGETRVQANHPLVKGREGLFEPVETAGVQRVSIPRPRRRPAAGKPKA